MKKLLTIAAIAAASTALAVESSNTFGILRVDSSAAQTIVSVPWVAAGGGDINVANVVKTANLNTGDKLYYYNGKEAAEPYTMWELTDGAWVQAANNQGETPSVSIARGGAIILVRANPASCFYLYGQYTSQSVETELALGTSSEWAFSLLAPPTTAKESINLNSDATWSNVGAGDSISLSNGKVLSWNPTEMKWGVRSFSNGAHNWDYDSARVAVGTGAWYISKTGAQTAPSVSWN